MTPYTALRVRLSARLFVFAVGATLLAIGAVTLAGYWAREPVLYQWDQTAVAMAPATGFGFLLTGAGFMVVATSNAWWQRRHAP